MAVIVENDDVRTRADFLFVELVEAMDVSGIDGVGDFLRSSPSEHAGVSCVGSSAEVTGEGRHRQLTGGLQSVVSGGQIDEPIASFSLERRAQRRGGQIEDSSQKREFLLQHLTAGSSRIPVQLKFISVFRWIIVEKVPLVLSVQGTPEFDRLVVAGPVWAEVSDDAKHGGLSGSNVCLEENVEQHHWAGEIDVD